MKAAFSVNTFHCVTEVGFIYHQQLGLASDRNQHSCFYVDCVFCLTIDITLKLQSQTYVLCLCSATNIFKNFLFEQKEIMKQQKDLIRIREERTGFKREYSLVMSERDAVHKEMDKLQEDLIHKQKEK